MDLIYSKGNEIFASQKFVRIPEVNNLMRSKGIDFFGDFVVFLYYVYKTNSQIGNDDDITYMKDYSISERIERTCSIHLSSRTPDEFLDNPLCQECIEIYQRLELTKLELMYENVKRDIDGYLERLSSIQYTKKQRVSIKTPQNLIEQGYPEFVSVEIDVENVKEKQDSIKASNELVEYAKKMEAAVMDEKKKKGKVSGSKAVKMFEDLEAVKEFKFVLYNEELFLKPND